VIGVVRLTHQNCVMLFLSLGYSVSPTVLDLLVSKFDKTRGKSRAIEYDNFIERCLTVKVCLNHAEQAHHFSLIASSSVILWITI